MILRDLLQADAEPFVGQASRLPLMAGETLAPRPEPFDFVLMDCAPSLGVLTLNALAAAREVFIPLQPHFLALHGLGKLLETTTLVAKRINPELRVTGIILCLYEGNTRLAQEVQRDLEAYLNRSRGVAVPWDGARVFTTRIRRNIKLAESPSFGRSVFGYAPTCNGAEDYQALALEVLGEPAPTVLAARVAVDSEGEVTVIDGAAVDIN